MSTRLWGLRIRAFGEALVVVGVVGTLGSLSVPLTRAARTQTPREDEELPERRRGPGSGALDAFEAAAKNPYPDLDALRREGEAKLAAGDLSPPGALVPRVRELLVTSPNPRSEVFVSGRRLGETPLVGQWSCRDGDTFRVDVVPKKGPARSLTVTCGGERLEVRAP